MTFDPYRVRAHNTATASANKIHDDIVAREYGFGGGLVPGVDVYAYLTHPVVARYGRKWLERGGMHAQFRRPVYDGRWVTVEAEGSRRALVLCDEEGETCATSTVRVTTDSAPPDIAAFPRAEVPEPRPHASAEVLGGADPLGTLDSRFDGARAKEYLDAISEMLPLYRDEGVAHPGWLLRRANRLLAANVELGPWIHVESDVSNFGLVHDGDVVSTRGRVTRVFERSGHRFVILDVASFVDNRPVMRAEHTAIYEPRRVTRH